MIQDVAIREQWFKIAVFAFPEYDNAMLQQFYDYWSEPTPSGKKMRFELEKTWDIKRRLQRWYNNNKNWNKDAKQNSRSEVQAELNSRLERWQQVKY